jgi:ketosteroid isomerase-like protein
VPIEVLQASKNWLSNFNSGKAKECVAGYTANAVMNVTPFGMKKGSKEINSFWVSFMKSGASNLIYTNISIEVVDANTAFLSANWSMNVGHGIIFQEKWEKKNNKWLLSYDNFEVLEQYKSPKKNIVNNTNSHDALVKVIKASEKFTNGFNTKNGIACGNAYAKISSMNAIPFASLHSKKEITSFWTQLIKDGATNLTYHNPKFEMTSNNTVILSSQWSMNIGEGKIFQEKWEKISKEWLLTYDEFKVLRQYK